MKIQKMNPNNLNPMQMKNMSSMMGMMNSIQKIGKGKRKYTFTLDKNMKKFFSKFLEEVQKQFLSNSSMPNVEKFILDLKKDVDNKDKKDIKVSYEELEFLIKILSDGIRAMDGVQYKWYQFVKKRMAKLLIKQYRDLLGIFKK